MFDSKRDVKKSVPLTQRDTDCASSQRQLRPVAVSQVASNLADEGHDHSGDHRPLCCDHQWRDWVRQDNTGTLMLNQLS